MTDLTVSALAERYKRAVSDAAYYAGTPSGQDRELNALRDQLIAAQAAEIERLRGHLTGCLDWMETVRVSDDCGKWDWVEDSEYTRARAELERAKP